MTAFSRAYHRTRRTKTPAIYFYKGMWWVAASGYSDQMTVNKAIVWINERNNNLWACT